jgi:hypothetical protein
MLLKLRRICLEHVHYTFAVGLNNNTKLMAML